VELVGSWQGMRSVRKAAVALGAAILAASSLLAFLAPARAEDPGLKVVGKMAPYQQGAYNGSSSLAVDPINGVAFTADPAADGVGRPVAYDLNTLKWAYGPADGAIFNQGWSPQNWTVDSEHKRLYTTFNTALTCTGLPPSTLEVIDYTRGGSGAWTLNSHGIPWPCLSPTQALMPRALSYAGDRLYVAGNYVQDGFPLTTAGGASQIAGEDNGTGSSLVVEQFDPTASKVDWAVDLRLLGCGAWDTFRPFVTRVPGAVVTYCFDSKTALVTGLYGAQGYVVTIPLAKDNNGVDMPVPSQIPPPPKGSGLPSPPATSLHADPVTGTILNPSYTKTPALSGVVYPHADPVTGNLYLATSDPANGAAVWVFSPPQHRFIGVISGGVADQPFRNTAVGYDDTTGRAYVLTANGILVADVRHSPLPRGTIFPVLNNAFRESNFVCCRNETGYDPYLKVFSAQHRIFAPIASDHPCPGVAAGACNEYVEVEDNVPAPPAAPKDVDPDSYTTQMDEKEGVTQADATASADASGAHVVVTGGLPRIVDASDPACTLPPGNIDWDTFKNAGDQQLPIPPERTLFNGRCAADQVLSPGDRDLYFGATRLDSSATRGSPDDSSATVNAQASGLTTGSRDDASFHDLPVTGSPQDNPVKSAECADPKSPGDTPPESQDSQVASSHASCDAAHAVGDASSSTAAFSVTGPGEPTVAVGHVTSSITSAITKEGQETVATATATGVRVGPLTFGQVMSSAHTKAHGRNGTAKAEFVRQWCNISNGGTPLVGGCIFPDDPDNKATIDRLNTLIGKIRISAPDVDTQGTPGGAQAVVIKNEHQQDADKTVNNDPSVTASAMEITYYNDGAEGRNRVVTQLAGVRTESRYGITPVPTFNPGPQTTTPAPTPEPDAPSTVETPAAPAPSAASTPDTFTTPSGQRVVTITARPVSSTHVLRLPAPGRPLVERILRVPGEILKAGINLLVENPIMLLKLASVWTLLATPLYLALRRRSRARALAA